MATVMEDVWYGELLCISSGVDSRKKSLGPAAQVRQQQRARGQKKGPGAELSCIKIWLNDLLDRQMARDGASESVS